ncbi:MAG: right-handed parallel beta-helix repeat-containing protein [Bacteroidota bacterium]
MKTSVYIFALMLFTVSNALPQTSVPGGIVNGTWTLTGSPYNVQGSIQIVNGDSLIIQPGVTVIFQGTYKLLVLGKLIAVGTVADTITFTAANPTDGWRGIRFDNTASANDTSRITYCKIQYGNASGSLTPEQRGGGIYINSFSKVVITYSRIVNCTADSDGGGIYISSANPIIKNNTISNNTLSGMGVNNGVGICLQSSNATISYNIITYNTNGVGIYTEGGDPSICYNTITYNGAGICVSFGSPTISNNNISYNSGGGGVDIENGFYMDHVILSNNIISFNTAQNTGGGITCYGYAIINNNSIFNNTAASAGGGIVCYTDSTIISNNFISNNTVSPTTSHYLGGGGIWCVNGDAGVTIHNNVISNNDATNGAGILCYNSSPIFVNNTVVNNSASNNGGALSCSGSSPVFRNCIFWGNTATTSGAQVFLYDEPSDPDFYYCDVEGGSAAFELNGNFYTGAYSNNININPQFVAPSGGSGTGFNGMTADWSLQSSSPCINAGDPGGTYPATDIAGNPRISGSSIDIGAFEYQTGTGFIAISIIQTNVSCNGGNDGSATVTATGGTAPYTYLWNTIPPQTSNTATGLSAGNYSVTVFDSNSAWNSALVTILQPNSLAILINTTNASCPICADGTATSIISGGTPPYLATWYTSPIQNGTTVTGLLPGQYGVCVIDQNGCVFCDTATVNIGGACSAYFDLYPDLIIPHQYSAVNMASGSPPLNYLWDWGDGTTDSVPFPTHTYSTAGFYAICLTITDSVGCTDMYCNSYYLQKSTNSMVIINVIPAETTGNNEISINNAFYIYPNPASDIITIESPIINKSDMVSICNIQGQILLQQSMQQEKMEIDIRTLAKGLYFLRVENKDGIILKKFMKE